MRNFGLDFLRFIAIFLVIGRHMEVCPENTCHFFHKISKVWNTGGWVGVDLFFVLSGFLISSLLFREAQTHAKIDIKTFLIRRGFKIYPAFWVLLGFTIVVRFFYVGSVPTQLLIGDLSFTQNYVGSLWDHTWSLAIEEHFYFGIAFLLFLMIRLSPGSPVRFQWIPPLFVILAVTCLSLRILTSHLLPYSPKWYLYGTHIRIDSLMFGVFLSWLWNYQDLGSKIDKIPGWLFTLLGVILLSPAFLFRLESTWWIPVFGSTLFYLGAGALVLGFLQLNPPKFRLLNWVATLGAYSYSIYLWHLPLINWGTSALSKLFGGLNYPWYFIIMFFGSFICGTVLSRLIEYPILSWRNRFFPSKSRPLNGTNYICNSSGKAKRFWRGAGLPSTGSKSSASLIR
jgi:peptidoglycan/LPS O-acetylase OafA/YrhL